METKTISRYEKAIETKKKKARNLSVFEGGAFSVSDGFGFRNIAPYALALGASNAMMGFLTSIPSLLGNFSQLLTYNLLGKYSRKKLVLIAIFIQAFFWLLLLIPGILFLRSAESNTPMILFLAIYTGLIVSGSIAGPAWSSWMKDIVPAEKTGRYFAQRSKIAGAVALVSMIIAGFLLDYFNKIEVLYGFFILLFFSFLFRSISGYITTKKYHPKFKGKKESYFSFFQFLNNMPFNNFGRFVVFISLIYFSMSIASPFFAVYLLRQRNFSYIVYMSLIMLIPLTSILTMNYWGKVLDQFGSNKVLKIVSLFLTAVPFIYFISSFFDNFWIVLSIIIPAEIIAGVGFGGLLLATTNFLFRTVSREKMVLCTSYMNFLAGIGIFLGATIGGFITSLSFWNPILLVFLISGVCRFLVYLIVLPGIKESVNEKSKYDQKDIISLTAINPRTFNHFNDIIYFRRTVDHIKNSKIFKRI